ncbi:uncharacterized protein TNCV_1112741 [Trichonephila clavipes]|uniref:Mutator-like transposase domain-containing protein n=1 Tax=Trichonephila clavipes TaxID=2585209 RepID=A0A8X6RGX7_TRICX|nr:uncharacterized protein TNCV_1112741 [Trichonephila clavipes]
MRAIGKGGAAARIFCGLMNLPPLPAKFERHNSLFLNVLKTISEDSMNAAVHEAVIANDNNSNIAVAVDGTWHKRGYSSLNGVVCATSVENGKVIDFEALTKIFFFMEIDNRVGRNQTTVLRISAHWTQEGNMDRHGRSHPPQCTTSREESRVVCQQGVHCLVYPQRRTTVASIINGAIKKGYGRQNGKNMSLLINHAFVSNITMVGFKSGDTVEWDVEHRHYAPLNCFCTGYYGIGQYWISLSDSSSTHCRYFKQRRGVGESCPFLASRLRRSSMHHN